MLITLLNDIRSLYQSSDSNVRKEALKSIENMEFSNGFFDVILIVLSDTTEVTLGDRQSAATLLKKNIDLWKITKHFPDDAKNFMIIKIFEVVVIPGMQNQIIDLLCESMGSVISMQFIGTTYEI